MRRMYSDEQIKRIAGGGSSANIKAGNGIVISGTTDKYISIDQSVTATKTFVNDSVRGLATMDEVEEEVYGSLGLTSELIYIGDDNTWTLPNDLDTSKEFIVFRPQDITLDTLHFPTQEDMLDSEEREVEAIIIIPEWDRSLLNSYLTSTEPDQYFEFANLEGSLWSPNFGNFIDGYRFGRFMFLHEAGSGNKLLLNTSVLPPYIHRATLLYHKLTVGNIPQDHTDGNI